jgi:hypothetical protein
MFLHLYLQYFAVPLQLFIYKVRKILFLTPKPDQGHGETDGARRKETFFCASQEVYEEVVTVGMHWVGGRGLVGSEDRSYITPSVCSLHGHHYWTLYYGDGPLEGQKVPTRRVALRHYFSRMY